MSCRILVIFDDQKGYSDALVRQWKRKTDSEYRIYQFTEKASVELFAKEHEITCILFSEVYESFVEEVKAKYYFRLTSQRSQGEEEEITSVYRFQSVERIYETIIQGCNREEKKSTQLLASKEPQIIGVYNPVHQSGQTTYAKALASTWGKEGLSVLYLSLEEYAGIGQSEVGQGDLGEVMYYLKQDIRSVNYRLASFVKNGPGYDYVVPIGMSKELRMITAKEWVNFLEVIREGSGYQLIILDLDSCVQGLLDILGLCECIHMPIIQERGGERKRNQFIWNLQRLQGEELIEKIQYKYLPELDITEQDVVENLNSYTTMAQNVKNEGKDL